MTSKNSFWDSIKENNKRRIWLWLVSALTYVIAFPTAVAMDISRGKSNEAYLIESLGETLGREALQQDLLNRMKICFGVENYALLAATATIAIISMAINTTPIIILNLLIILSYLIQTFGKSTISLLNK